MFAKLPLRDYVLALWDLGGTFWPFEELLYAAHISSAPPRGHTVK
jgi:hypothetical protein